MTDPTSNDPGGVEEAVTGRIARRVSLVGLGSGFLAGLLGIGGGALTVFGLVALARFSQHRAHATALSAIPLVALAGALVFGASGNVDLGVASWMIGAAAVGALFGARLMAAIPERALRRAFGLLMLLVGVRLIL